MPQIRRNPITGEEILFAPERARRPHAFVEAGGEADDTDVCPFCPGNESLTPPSVAEVGRPWRVRVFPNKYPASLLHEIVVESPQHDASFADIGWAPEAVRLYVERYEAHSNHGAHTAVFRNHGVLGGASIQHLHSQLVTVQHLPPRIVKEAAAFARGRCPLCVAIDDHRESGLVIRETPSFVWLAPSGSGFAYQQWVVPRRHSPEMSGMTPDERAELASLLQASTAAMLQLSDAHNWLFINFRTEARAHWYVDLFPRLTTVAGFELSTGTFIHIVDPAEAVRVLKEHE